MISSPLNPLKRPLPVDDRPFERPPPVDDGSGSDSESDDDDDDDVAPGPTTEDFADQLLKDLDEYNRFEEGSSSSGSSYSGSTSPSRRSTSPVTFEDAEQMPQLQSLRDAGPDALVLRRRVGRVVVAVALAEPRHLLLLLALLEAVRVRLVQPELRAAILLLVALVEERVAHRGTRARPPRGRGCRHVASLRAGRHNN